MKRMLLINWLDLWGKPEICGGGAERQLREIIERGKPSDWQVDFFASRAGRMANLCTGQACPVPGVTVHHHGGWYTANYAIARQLKRYCRTHPVDVVVEYISKVPFFSPRLVDVPVVAMVPHLFRQHIYQEAGLLTGLYVNTLEKMIPRIYKNVTFIAVSPSTRDDLIDLGIDAEQIRVVYNGVDHQRYRQDESVTREEHLLVHVGRLKRYKCVDHLILAMNRIKEHLPTAKLVILGDGSDRPRLEKLIARYRLHDRVTLLGYVAEEEKVRWLQRAQVMLNPSSKEGWGLTNIEANACGTPVVAYDSMGLRDSVDDSCGKLVPFGNVERLAQETIKFLADAVYWQEKSTNAVQWAGQFSWQRCADETFAIITEVVAKKQGKA